MIIWGWTIAPIVLGTKIDHCTSCGVTGPHALIRKTWWGTLFWIPFLFLRFQHGMACTACGAWTGIPFRAMRAGLRTGRLPLRDRRRPNSLELRDQIGEATGRRPTDTELYDTVERNPKRGIWDLATKVWPVAAGALVAVIAVGALGPRPTPTPIHRPTAHTCWLDRNGDVSGCRNDDGGVEGYAIGTPATCWFIDPLPTGEFTIYCPVPSPSGD